MKKLFKSILFIGILVAISIGASVFAAGEIISTDTAVQTTTTSYSLKGRLIVEQSTLDPANSLYQIGFVLENNENEAEGNPCQIIPNIIFDNNGYWAGTNGLIMPGKVFSASSGNKPQGSTWFYRACGIGTNGTNYDGSVESFTIPIEGDVSIETLDTVQGNISSTSAKLELKVNGNGVIQSGFKIGTEINFQTGEIETGGFPDVCFYVNNGVHNDGGIYNDIVQGLQPESGYYFQGCGLNSTTEFLGGIKSFTTKPEPVQTDNDIIAECVIDYVEFTPKNQTNLTPDSGIEFDTFVVLQGKQIGITIHPKNQTKCENIKIYELWIRNLNTNAVSLEVVDFPGTFFNSGGEYSRELVAGDRDCGGDTCKFGIYVKYGLWKNGDVWQESIFRTWQDGSEEYAHQYPNTTEKRKKGILEFAKKDGNIRWKIFEPGVDPTYEEIQGTAPTGPCVDPQDPTEYLEGCYEFLAPIPGIELDAKGNFDGENFIVDGDRIAIRSIRDYELGNYVNKLFQIAIALLGVISVIMIVIAGVQYMTVESIYGKSDAKQRIVGAVSGLILALGIFLILNTINPELLEVNFADKIQTVSVNVKIADIGYLNSIDVSGIPDVDLNTVLENNAFVLYIAHQQGKAGASAIFHSVKNGKNKVVANPYFSPPKKIQDNVDNQFKKPTSLDFFLNYFYKRIKKFSNSPQRDNIPQEYEQAIQQASTEIGVDYEAMITMCMIESYLCTRNVDNGQGYRGLFQFGKAAWADYGNGNYLENVFDPYQNSLAAAKMFKANIGIKDLF